ncbi:MAG: hypothetical protein WB816_13010, partial [Methylocystis sp.]
IISGTASKATLNFEVSNESFIGHSYLIDTQTEPGFEFPPSTDQAALAKLGELKKGPLFREKPASNPTQVIEWRDITFARADVLRLWSEHPRTLAYRLAEATPWTAPVGLDKATLALLPERKRVALAPVVNLLAFAQLEDPAELSEVDKIARRMQASDALFLAAADERVKIFGTPAERRMYRGNPFVPKGPPGPITPFEFANDKLALSHQKESAIGSKFVAENYVEQGGHPDGVKWFDVIVEREDLAVWLGKLIPRTRLARAAKGIAACRDWLVRLRQSGPQGMTKDQFLNEAKTKFAIGPDQFRQAWEQAARLHPAESWSQAGRPPGTTKNRAEKKSSGE